MDALYNTIANNLAGANPNTINLTDNFTTLTIGAAAVVFGAIFRDVLVNALKPLIAAVMSLVRRTEAHTQVVEQSAERMIVTPLPHSFSFSSSLPVRVYAQDSIASPFVHPSSFFPD